MDPQGEAENDNESAGLGKVRMVGPQEFYNQLISLRYAVVDLRGPEEWIAGPRMDMAQPYWAQGEERRGWRDALGFEDSGRVLLYAATVAIEHQRTGGEVLAVPAGLRRQVGRFVADLADARVQEVLLLEGGLDAFIAQYAFLADGLALHPDHGSHFYPSHIWKAKAEGQSRGLFLGSKFPSRDRKALDDLHIRHILNVTWEVANEFEDCDYFVYHRCVVADKESEDIARYFEECWAFIDDALRSGSSVLVHCAQGVSRSAAIVVSYLIGSCGWRLPAAYTHVQKMRDVVNINRGFYQQLLQLDARLHSA